ncbi:MAG: sulfatase [Planctomycetes bacterium]|nr:sulfatase [Planctomycetota bacterium]
MKVPLLAALFLFMVPSLCLAHEVHDAEKPNFIVIFADDLGYGDLSCYGHPSISTPYIDRMATEGQRWTDFYAAAPVCTPSRAGLLTGRYPTRTGTASGVFFEWSAEGMDPAEVTIAETLKSAGYTTAAVGKWHLGHRKAYLPTSQGFDSYYGIPYSNDMGIDAKMTFAKDVKLRGGVTLEQAQMPAKRKTGLVPLMENEEIIEFPCDQDSLTKRYTERCVEFIKENQKKPFFLYYASSFPHVPLHASAEFRGKSKRGLYGDVVEELDASVGRILETLRQTGLDKNTIVVFTSDNGPWLSEKLRGGSSGLLRGGKGMTWDGGMREPTVFWGPGQIKAGSICREVGSTLDLYTTFTSLAGIKAKGEDSLDLTPALKGGKSPRELFYFYRGDQIYALRWGQWKLHLVTEGWLGVEGDKEVHKSPLLYHLGRDPGEKYDVASHHQDVVRKMLSFIDKQKEDVKPGRNLYVKKLDYVDRPAWSK